MKKNQSKRLSLHRESILRLEDSRLGNAQGATGELCVPHTAQPICHLPTRFGTCTC